jgi:hypothetical protein
MEMYAFRREIGAGLKVSESVRAKEPVDRCDKRGAHRAKSQRQAAVVGDRFQPPSDPFNEAAAGIRMGAVGIALLDAGKIRKGCMPILLQELSNGVERGESKDNAAR